MGNEGIERIMGFLMWTALFHFRAFQSGWRPEMGFWIVVAVVIGIVLVFVVLGSSADDEGPPQGGLRA